MLYLQGFGPYLPRRQTQTSLSASRTHILDGRSDYDLNNVVFE